MQIVLISSCINNDYGVFKKDERFNQTLNTIKSLHLIDDVIECHLVDTSVLSDNQINTLSELCIVHNIPDLHDHNKSIGELKIINYFLDNYNISNFTHFHKISGRYYLNEKYIENNNSAYIFKKNDKSWDGRGVIETRYYKIPIEHLDKYRYNIKSMLSRTLYSDIEHEFYQCEMFPLKYTFEYIGLSGFLSPDGSEVND